MFDRRFRLAAAGLLAAALMSPVMGFAQLQDPDQQTCTLKLNAAGAKLVGATNKQLGACIKDKGKGKLAPGATIESCLAEDAKGKVAKSAGKVDATASKSCSVLPDFGPRSASAVRTGLGGDVINLAGLFGCAVDPAVQPDVAACQGAVIKTADKLLKAQLKEFNSCTKAGFGASPPLDSVEELEACASADPKSKVAGLVAKAGPSVAKKCGVDIAAAFPGECSGATAETLFACVAPVVRCGLCRALNEADDLGLDCDLYDDGLDNETCEPLTTCAFEKVRFLLRAGNGVGGDTSATKIDTGWQGSGHGNDIPEGSLLTSSLACPPEGDASDVCDLTGSDPDGNPGVGRCRDATNSRCTNLFASDPACPGSGLCDVLLTPPSVFDAAGFGFCTVTRLAGDLTGTLDRQTGAAEIDLSLAQSLYLGIDSNAPCPVCVEDLFAGDGALDGTCDGGPADGAPCDAHGTTAAGDDVSFDCPPNPTSNVSGTGLALPVVLTTGSSSLASAIPCSAAPALCPCGACTGSDDRVGCSANADCTDSVGSFCDLHHAADCAVNADCDAVDTGPCRTFSSRCDQSPSTVCATNGDCIIDAGDCLLSECAAPTGAASSASTKPNACSDGTCTDVGGNEGACLADAGAPCFLAPVTADGTSDTTDPVLAATVCTGATGNGTVNAILGLPGPVRMTIEAERVLE